MVLAYVSYGTDGGTYGFPSCSHVTSARFHSTKLFRIFAKVTWLLRMSMPSDAAANLDAAESGH